MLRTFLKTSYFLLIFCIVFNAQSSVHATEDFSHGKFRCTGNSFQCHVEIKTLCTIGFEPLLPLFQTCEEYFNSGLVCPTIGEYGCRCRPNTNFCDGNLLKTCNGDGTNILPHDTVDCSKTPGEKCVSDGGIFKCASPDDSGGSGDGVSIPTSSVVNINDVIDNLLVGVFGFKFDSPNATLGNILTRLIYYVFGLTGIGLLFFLIIGGFKYLTSAGDPKKVESAKGTLTTTIIGFVIVFVAYWLTQIVNYVFKLGGPF